MNHQPLLTVVVPCYHVEKYIDKCISSIVNQTYPNLEILLIDDGSTDHTGQLCDTWQNKDHRIRVIHKQNEGSSYARKTGVENATAEYVTFVDADDWIDKNMYTNMMSALLTTQSDIAQCGVCDAYEDGTMQHRASEKIDGTFEVIDRIRGVLLIIESKEWQSYMVNKIFKKSLFDRIEFPKGRGLSDDTTIIHILFHHASQTIYLRDEYYYYLQRSGSTCHSDTVKTSKMKNQYDTFNAFYERYCFVEQHPEYHPCLVLVKNYAFSRGMRALRNSIIYPQYFPKDHAQSVYHQLNSMQFKWKDIDREVFAPLPLMRMEIFVFLRFPAFHRILVKVYAKIIHIIGKQ